MGMDPAWKYTLMTKKYLVIGTFFVGIFVDGSLLTKSMTNWAC